MTRTLSQSLEYRKEKFSRAALTYHRSSAMQKQVAERLGSFLEGISLEDNVAGLEIACGTGHLTEKLLQNYSNVQWTISDTAETMLTSCRNRLLQEGFFSKKQKDIQWKLLDGMDFKMNTKCSIITSSAIVQWFIPLHTHLECVWQSLKPQGYYVFSGFHTDNFPELQSILKEEPLSSHLEVGHTEEDVVSALKKVGFSRCTWLQETVEAKYASLYHFLKTIQDFGGAGNPQVVMTPQKMRFLEREYQSRFSMGSGVLATWRPWYVVAQKIGSSESSKRREE